MFTGRVHAEEVHCGKEPNHFSSRQSIQAFIHVVSELGQFERVHTKVGDHAAELLGVGLMIAKVVFVGTKVAPKDFASFKNGPEMNLHGGAFVVIVVCFLVALDLIL